MNTTLKKTLAVVSAWVIALSALPLLNVLAANEPTPVYTLVSWDNLWIDDTLQVTVPAAWVAENGDAIAVYVKTAAWAPVNLSTASLSLLVNSTEWTHDLANWKIELLVTDSSVAAWVTVTFAWWDLSTWNYSVSYVSTADSSAALFYVNWANQVNVTAYVSPILTMNLVWNSINFWELNVAWNNTAVTDSEITVSTNAAGWLSVLAATVWWDSATTANALWMPWSTNTIPWIWAKTAIWSLPATEYFWATVALTPAAAWQNLATSANFDWWDVNNIDWVLATTTWPTKDAALAVSYHAWIDELTEAWTYSSTVTYTVTWSF